MRKIIEIEIETTPKKKFFLDKGKPTEEEITDDIDKELCEKIDEFIREIVEDEEFEDKVLDNLLDDYPKEVEIKDFCDFGSVKIMMTTRTIEATKSEKDNEN